MPDGPHVNNNASNGVFTEDCIYEPPKCDPPPALYREMRLIGGKLPAPSKRPALRITPQIRIPRKTEARTYKQVMKPTTPGGDGDGEKMPICKKEEKGSRWLC